MTSIAGKEPSTWEAKFPLIRELVAYQETAWFNPGVRSGKAALTGLGLTVADIDDAADRMRRFAPYIAQVFPETRLSAGIIESPLYAVPFMQAAIERREGIRMPGKLWVKMDAELPISGSIKARGGIYEVLHHAEWIAIDAGLITHDSDYRELDSPEAHELFSEHSIAVGSTGNLGLSIGIMSARLGFDVTVHMSSGARPWKKEMLRRHGVEVVEYDSDYSVAVSAGRKQARSDPSTHFVDDENSTTLFLGYAVAGRRLAGQLQALDVLVDEEHPLFVYLPCGVGGGPGGITFGLKTVFGDAVHAVFAEPTHSPSMLLGVRTGLHDAVCVQDFGIDNITSADGLAVGRPSGFVGRSLEHAIDGYYTVSEENLYRYLTLLRETEGLKVEPSAVAGFLGPQRVLADAAYLKRTKLTPKALANATHLAWATGGSMVPPDEMNDYFRKGVELLLEF